ncbi:OmpA family protein [bacterium]|nr:OmpA family protein [bacterium]
MKRILKTRLLVPISLIVLLACGETKVVNGQYSQDIPKKALKYFNEAYRHYQYGEYREAEKSLQSAIDKHPSYVDAWDLLGRTYKALWENDKAIHAFRQALIYNPKHFFSHYELGNLYYNKQMLDSAQYYFNNVLKVSDSEDKYTQTARRQIRNIEFAREAMKNPVDITPVNLGPRLNSKNEEYSPALTIDGNTMFFTWRDGSLDIYHANEELYYSTKDKNGDWTYSRPIGPPINTADNEGAFSVTADGRYIFYTACNRSGGIGQCDIWLTSNTKGTWDRPLNLGKPVNSKHWESQPCISSDGRKLYFASDRPGGYGGIDLWVSTFTDTGWSAPVNLGPDINTIEDEQFPFIHPDGVTLYFSSYGHPGMGNADLFISHLKPDGTFAKPENLGYPINSVGHDWNLIVGRDGKTAVYSSDQIEGGQGGMDLYTFTLPENKRAQQVSYAQGTVFDEKTLKKLGASVELIPLDGGSPTITFAPSTTGEFLVALRGNTKYALNVSSKGYLFYSEHFDMPEVPTDEPYKLEIPLKKIEVGNAIILKNVFFDTDKFDLKDESTAELEKLYQFLEQNPDLKIEISGHTDNQGSSAHNLELSKNRALAVYNYLVSKGIDESRLSYAGYGDTQPIADNETDEGRAKNRRTEFKIVD